MIEPFAHKASAPFAHTSGPRDAKVVICGEAWGEAEAETGRPFVGVSGKELWRMLGEAWPEVAPIDYQRTMRALYMRDHGWIDVREDWLREASVLLTNVFAFRPDANDLETICVPKAERGEPYPWPAMKQGGYVPRKIMAPEVDRLLAELKAYPRNLVIAAGNAALAALCHTSGIMSRRGAICESAALPGLKVLPTIHPAAIMRQWQQRPTVLQDLMKAAIERRFPEIRRPERYICINPSIEEINGFCDVARDAWRMAIDIETMNGQIRCVGFAVQRQSAIVVPFIDKAKPGWSYWSDPADELRAWDLVAALCDLPCQKIFQNGLYDIQYLVKSGCPVRNMTADTMLLHHSMYPELPKSLGFLGSVYTNERAWKLLRKDSEELKRDE
jgi:uracil-DNA glycosylase